jgi:hypothetical protein
VLAHRKKYDEGVLSVASMDKLPIIATGIRYILLLIIFVGGADSLVKILHE